MPTPFLPTTVEELRRLGWDEVDVVLFTGDAYVDHPSFGAAVIGRTLEAAGYRVAIVPQPNWQDDLRDFRKMGRPRLFFGVTAGAMDSMVNHYTANLRLRSDDAYTAGGGAGRRPDRAVEVYCRALKKFYPDVPVVAGGIEASLRRLTHFDYWTGELRPSILATSGVDAVVYGMGERPIVALAQAIERGDDWRNTPQIAYANGQLSMVNGQCIELNSFEKCVENPRAFEDNFVVIETESNRLEPTATLIERVGEQYVIVNPPYPLATTAETDALFDLPYSRQPHPRYRNRGEIPAWAMIRHSVTLHRGCFGGCSFCTISAHQGKHISSRSEASVLREVAQVAAMPDFRGNISDLGGPSANMYAMGGKNVELCRKCTRPSCAFPQICRNLNHSHKKLLALYQKAEAVAGVRHIYIGSGIRYDLFDDSEYLNRVVTRHTSGRLKVAPEHTCYRILDLMRKPSYDLFRQLDEQFHQICRQAGLRYQLIPYFISSHPGCTEADMRSLAATTRGVPTEQVQDFTPTPMTLSSVMFHTGRDPYTGEKLYVARTQNDKRRQKEYFFKK